MKNIKIRLNQDYKQFKKNFEINLQGNLIIISGVNGSGKSQFMDILNKSQFIKEGTSNLDLGKYYIDSEIIIDDHILDRTEISKRTFKENISINNISVPSPKNSQWNKDEAWENFSNYSKWDKNTNDFLKSKAIIQNCLKDNGFPTSPKWNPNMKNNTEIGISEEQFKEVLPDDFVWEKDDLFSNRISELFYEFAVKRNSEQVKMSMTPDVFNNEEYIKDAPWTILNELFETLNFNYRFKKDYDYESPNFKEKLAIYPLLNDGNLDENSPRELSDLSDGEKSIISLIFALLNENRRPFEKLLLLDEFDNTLNPSLIEALYKVLENYFIKKDVVVIMTTHSPVSISLAPDYAICYEMFKQDNTSPKIIHVDKDQYSELKVANKNYYEKLKNQVERIKELESIIKSIESNKILFVEDKYTNIYKLAWLKLNDFYTNKENLEIDFDNNAPFKILSKGNKNNLKGFLTNPSMDELNGKNVVGLFDFDDAYIDFESLPKGSSVDKQIRWSECMGTEEKGIYVRRERYSNIYALMLPVPSFRTDIASTENTANRLEVELLFKDEEIEKMYGNNGYKTEKVTGSTIIPKIVNKADFWKKASNLPKEKFEAFIPLFTIINSLLAIDESGSDK